VFVGVESELAVVAAEGLAAAAGLAFEVLALLETTAVLELVGVVVVHAAARKSVMMTSAVKGALLNRILILISSELILIRQTLCALQLKLARVERIRCL